MQKYTWIIKTIIFKLFKIFIINSEEMINKSSNCWQQHSEIKEEHHNTGLAQRQNSSREWSSKVCQTSSLHSLTLIFKITHCTRWSTTSPTKPSVSTWIRIPLSYSSRKLSNWWWTNSLRSYQATSGTFIGLNFRTEDQSTCMVLLNFLLTMSSKYKTWEREFWKLKGCSKSFQMNRNPK